MLTIEEVRFYLEDNETPDTIIDKALLTAREVIARKTNNYYYDENGVFVNTLPDELALEDVVLEMVIKKLNEDTKRKAGISSISDGSISISYSEGLSKEAKMILMSYNKVKSRVD